MSKIDLGQAIAILANLGVIAGIVFLAIELQQNNLLLRNEARYNLHLSRREEIEQLALQPELGEVWRKAQQSEPLTDSEWRRFQSSVSSRFVR